MKTTFGRLKEYVKRTKKSFVKKKYVKKKPSNEIDSFQVFWGALVCKINKMSFDFI